MKPVYLAAVPCLVTREPFNVLLSPRAGKCDVGYWFIAFEPLPAIWRFAPCILQSKCTRSALSIKGATCKQMYPI